MLVYGDIERTESVEAVSAAISEMLGEAGAMPAGLPRHAKLVGTFIKASELVQAVADAEFGQRGFDARSHRQDAGAWLLHELALCVDLSWRSGFAQVPLPPYLTDLVQPVAGLGELRFKTAEGYAHYALYPETYLEAARASGLGAETCVIGIRSIGAGLAALVSAALAARQPITVRPVGHPFERELRVSDALAQEVAAHRNRDFAIADEGPGLSGSSFMAVSGWLRSMGIAPDRIHLFPSHQGEPGGAGRPEILARWRSHRRHRVDTDAALLASDDPSHGLAGWVAGLVGPLDGPLKDISGGGWRRLPAFANRPLLADPRLERRKFLARAGGETWLAKFAGLGELGERKTRDARLLADAGFTPEIAGLCHGFIVQRWDDGSVLWPGALPRDRLVERMGAYLGFRSRRLAASNDGASLSRLAEMAEHNAGEALGPEAAARLRDMFRKAGDLESKVRRVATDNRMHDWEWLVGGDGRLIKTDAVDHSAGHDLVGCQDTAWDIAGAIVEHELSLAEGERLRGIAEESGGAPISHELVGLLLPCYLAFQLGLWSMAADSNGPDEEPTLRATAQRYADGLAAMLS